MPKRLEFNSSFAYNDVAGTGPSVPASTFTSSSLVDELQVFNILLPEGVVDQEIDLGSLGYIRYLAIRSDVLLEIEIDDRVAAVGHVFTSLDMEASKLELTNLGLLFDDGTATAGNGTTLTDTDQSWVYTTLYGRVKPPCYGKLSFVIEIGGCVGFIEINIEDEDATGDDIATAIQTQIDKAPAIGSDRVTVTWVDEGNDEGHLRFVSDKAGNDPIIIRPHKDDQRSSLNALGLDLPTVKRGTESLVGMDVRIVDGGGSGQSQEITAVTTTVLTVGSFSPAAAAGSVYRILKPQAGTVDILMAR